MKHLPNISRAKEEIDFLQEYVHLAETYEATTLHQQILKSYAYTGSIQKVTDQLNEERAAEKLLPIDTALVSQTIQSRPQDSLHRLLRTNYMNKTKHSRRNSAKVELYL
jgi:hypothetical protein